MSDNACKTCDEIAFSMRHAPHSAWHSDRIRELLGEERAADFKKSIAAVAEQARHAALREAATLLRSEADRIAGLWARIPEPMPAGAATHVSALQQAAHLVEGMESARESQP